MADSREHPSIPTLKRQLAEGQIDRREFLRYATLLGLSAPAAYAAVRAITGERLVGEARAQGTPPKGGTLRIGMRCQDVKDPHTFSWVERSNTVRQVCDYLTVTGTDNITRPGALRKVGGEPRPQDLDAPAPQDRQVAQRPAVHGGRRGVEHQAGARPEDWLLGPGAHEGVHPRGVRDRGEGRQGEPQEVDAPLGRERGPEGRRLHREAQRQDAADRGAGVAVPLPVPDPRPGGERRVQGGLERDGGVRAGREPAGAQAGAQGAEGSTGAAGRTSTPSSSSISETMPRPRSPRSRASRSTGSIEAAITQLDALKKLGHVQLYQVTTAQTAVARVHPVKPFDDKRVRQALRYADRHQRGPPAGPPRASARSASTTT